MSSRALLSLTLACALVSVYASGRSIGLATADGSFQINSVTVQGNGTLFDGSALETAQAPSQVSLNNGARLRLATDTRAKVYQDRLVLEQGSGQMQSWTGYPVEARSLRIHASSPDAVATVHVTEGSPVEVAAVRGTVRVANAAGVVVANLDAGGALSFAPQEGATGPTKVSGCLLSTDAKFVVVDQTANVEVAVQGAALAKEVGNRVEITGAADPAQVVTVQSIKRLAKGGCASVAKASGPDGAAPKATKATKGKVFTGTTLAIIGGVAVASSVGLAAAGTFSGGSGPTPVSR